MLTKSNFVTRSIPKAATSIWKWWLSIPPYVVLLLINHRLTKSQALIGRYLLVMRTSADIGRTCLLRYHILNDQLLELVMTSKKLIRKSFIVQISLLLVYLWFLCNIDVIRL